MSRTKALRETLRHGEELDSGKVAARLGCTPLQARHVLNKLWCSNELQRIRSGVYRKNPLWLQEEREHKYKSRTWAATVRQLQVHA